MEIFSFLRSALALALALARTLADVFEQNEKKHKTTAVSLQGRRILGGRNLFRVRIVRIVDFMTVDDWGE